MFHVCQIKKNLLTFLYLISSTLNYKIYFQIVPGFLVIRWDTERCRDKGEGKNTFDATGTLLLIPFIAEILFNDIFLYPQVLIL